MASLKSKQSLLPSRLRVVRVDPDGLRTSDPLDEQSSLLAFHWAWQFLAPAVAQTGDHTKETVLHALGRGERQLWVSDTSAAITEMITYPSGLRVLNGWLSGGNLDEILSWFPMMEDWGRARGAVRARIYGRRGWARAAGYREIRTVMVKDL